MNCEEALDTAIKRVFEIDDRMSAFKDHSHISKKTDRQLKYIKYVILAFLIFVVCTFDVTAFSTFSPWDVFGMLAAVGKAPDFSYVAENLTIGFVLLILITIGSMFVERFFCRYLCPLGAFFALTSKLRIVKIRKTRTKCGSCRICTNNCAMGIPLYKYEGSGIGFRNRTTTVSVVVENGKISDISSVSYGDDRKFYSRAFSTVTQEIISSHSFAQEAAIF